MAAVALSNHFLIINKVPLKDSHLEVLKQKIIGTLCFGSSFLPLNVIQKVPATVR